MKEAFIQPERIQELHRVYGTSVTSFLNSPHTFISVRRMGGEAACITRSFPTFNEIAAAYGEEASVKWISKMIDDLNRYSGLNKQYRMTDFQISECAKAVLNGYPNMKISVFALYIEKAKMGLYFHGDISPRKVSGGLEQFMEYVNSLTLQLERERQTQQLIRSSHDRCVTRDEYNQIVLDAQMGDEKALRRLIPPDLPQSERKDFINFILTYDPFKMGRR